MDNKDKSKTYNSLLCVVKGLEQHYTTIDLRDESYLTGKITFVDGSMNVHLENVVFYDNRGRLHKFEYFYVKNRLIRYVHIPKHLKVEEVTQAAFNSMQRKKPNVQKSSAKVLKAKRYHKETVQNVFNISNQSDKK